MLLPYELETDIGGDAGAQHGGEILAEAFSDGAVLRDEGVGALAVARGLQGQDLSGQGGDGGFSLVIVDVVET